MKYSIGQLVYTYVFDIEQNPYVIRYLSLITEYHNELELYSLLLYKNNSSVIVYKDEKSIVTLEEKEKETEEESKLQEYSIRWDTR